MVGRFSRIAEKIGVSLPADDRRTAEDALDGLLELSRSEESRARQLACQNLCTCHIRAGDDRVWTRLLELVEDPDPLVRGDVIHALTDSTPAPRVPAVIQALESLATTRTSGSAAALATGAGSGVTAAATTAVLATGARITPPLPVRAGLSGMFSLLRSRLPGRPRSRR